jgi:hypothetical protein
MNAAGLLKELDGQEMSVETFAARLAEFIEPGAVETVLSTLEQKGFITRPDGRIRIHAKPPRKRSSVQARSVSQYETLSQKINKVEHTRMELPCTLARDTPINAKTEEIRSVFGGEVLKVENFKPERVRRPTQPPPNGLTRPPFNRSFQKSELIGWLAGRGFTRDTANWLFMQGYVRRLPDLDGERFVFVKSAYQEIHTGSDTTTNRATTGGGAQDDQVHELLNMFESYVMQAQADHPAGYDESVSSYIRWHAAIDRRHIV